MAITTVVPDRLFLQMMRGFHNFQQSGDTFKMALYYATANLGSSTTGYTTVGEVVGTNYAAGGITMTQFDPVVSNNKAIWDFQDKTFLTVTLTDVGGCMIYNSTQSNSVVLVYKFPTLITAVAQTINVTFPGATSTSAILRMRSVS